jgi:hydroxyacylglutathione hydrolase
MNIETIVVGAFEVNCFVIWGESKEAIIIDPGCDAEVILDFLQARQLTVASYMLTHGHMDHISALAPLHDACPAPIGLHSKDITWAFTESNQMPPYGIPRKPSEISRVLAEGQVWQDGGLTYKVIESPGHTPGGVCFLFPTESVLITGDTLFAGSVGRTDFPGGDSRVLKASLKRLAALDDPLKVYPGHGPTTTIGYEKKTNYFMQG